VCLNIYTKEIEVISLKVVIKSTMGQVERNEEIKKW